MKLRISKFVVWEILELTVSDDVSWLDLIKLNISSDDFFQMFVKNMWIIHCEWEIKLENIENIWKTREFEYIDIPYSFWDIKKDEWIKRITPEWYSYYWDRNYWRQAVFIKFV